MTIVGTRTCDNSERTLIPPAEQWATGVRHLKELGDYAAGLGLQIALELEPFKLSLLNDVPSMVRFIDDVGHPATVGCVAAVTAAGDPSPKWAGTSRSSRVRGPRPSRARTAAARPAQPTSVPPPQSPEIAPRASRRTLRPSGATPAAFTP